MNDQMQRSVMFISFDAVAVSGITVESLKLAKKFIRNGFSCYLDLGYDIKIDKGNFDRPYKEECYLYSDILTLSRLKGIADISGYSLSFIQYVRDVLISKKIIVTESEANEIKSRVEHIAEALSEKILSQWKKLNIAKVIVENGTLPENIIYTRALYLSIARYGSEFKLGKYVIWRDHDLMWNSEKNVMKYGVSPWENAIKPCLSPYINYVTLNGDLKTKLEEWCGNNVSVNVKKNTYDFHCDSMPNNIRPELNIPDNDIIIARTTRIIPQKRIDRDIILVSRLNEMLAEQKSEIRVWLVLAGDPLENPQHFAELQKLAQERKISNSIRYVGALYHNFMSVSPGTFTIEDLYYSCDLVSFLTSWDYDSYGNPIGEAISSRRCYITSQYEYYHEVYGQYGFDAPIMPISSESDKLPDEDFIQKVFALITNKQQREYISEKNFVLGKHVLASDLTEIFDNCKPEAIMRDTTFVSVVLPVFNESARIDAVLSSLFNQQSINALITHNSYELIIVDNNSTDDSVSRINAFKENNPSLDIHIIKEQVQGVSSARKRGMDYAALRSRIRDSETGETRKHYIISADADCTVDSLWLHTLIDKMISENGDLGTCNYYYNYDDFRQRPNLYREIKKTLRCRDFSFSLFGGFPDGKGFAVERQLYEKSDGIEILYQLNNGGFVEHLSDDWDFGIKVIACGGKPVYARESCVEINSRRVDTILDEVITGIAYGSDGIIIMKDVRPESEARPSSLRDTDEAQSQQAWFYSIKDYIPKNIILPALLNPNILLDREDVRDFFNGDVADRLYKRIHEIKREMSIVDFKPIHAYKTPAYRLYFEFRDAIFCSLRRAVGDDIGYPPPLPSCFENVTAENFERFVWYFCEDRESGEAHNYFANGGVF